MLPYMSETMRINQIIEQGASSKLTDKEFIEKEIQGFKASRKRQDMFVGEMYYIGKHGILRRKRTAIGQDGNLQEIHNLPNNRVVDNQ